LLTPHTRYTLEINTRARSDLLGEHGVIARVVSSGGAGQDVVAQRAFKSFTYQAMCLPDNLKERGLEGLKEYYYREDALLLWFAINKQPPPVTKEGISMEQLMDTLPDMSQSSVQMAFTWHLGRKVPNKILLGCFDEEYFTEEGAKEVIAEFEKELKLIEEQIRERNEGLPLKYEYLKPSNIENSVSI
ncbi:hypothetical protein scyTo_0021812, partial [Scyliorhinus torazame]|nr:hypothetical protein [Scyliorhinus torazame]